MVPLPHEGVTVMLYTPVKPMLLQPSDTPPVGDSYIHNLKFDGHRAILHYSPSGIRFWTRHGNECTNSYIPEIQNIRFNATDAILDGEMIVPDENGCPCFESVLSRLQANKQSTVRRLAQTLPSQFIAFDILWHNGTSLCSKSLEERLHILEKAVIPSSDLVQCPTFTDGVGLFNITKQKGLEGIVSKRLDSTYLLGKRPVDTWHKIKAYLRETVTVTAIRKKQFGWKLGLGDQGERYAGICEYVPAAERKALWNISRNIIRKETDEWLYLEPVIKGTVKFQAWTKSGLMRSPYFEQFAL